MQPFVTAMIVVRNEEKTIERALLSLLNQDYPKECYELIIIDSMSTDGTLAVAQQVVKEFGQNNLCAKVTFLKNEKLNLASGWNLGIKNANGEYVFRIDAHAQADENLIKYGLEVLDTYKDVGCVGGVLINRPTTYDGAVICNVLSSPFGVGNSKFRCTTQSGYSDTAAYGLYRREVFDEVGLFNEEFWRNQDNEMHGRIKDAGYRFYVDVRIKNIYHPRETVGAMIKQAYGNGKWNIKTIKMGQNNKGLSIRHLVPLCFVLANIFLVIGGFFCDFLWKVLLTMYILYLTFAIFFSIKKEKRFTYFLVMPFYFYLLHISYGLGSLLEIFSFE